MNEREAHQHGHAPACTCVDCTRARLRKVTGGGFINKLLRFFRLKR